MQASGGRNDQQDGEGVDDPHRRDRGAGSGAGADRQHPRASERRTGSDDAGGRDHDQQPGARRRHDERRDGRGRRLSVSVARARHLYRQAGALRIPDARSRRDRRARRSDDAD